MNKASGSDFIKMGMGALHIKIRGKKVLNISNEDCESGQHSRKVPSDKKWVSLLLI